MVKNGEKIVQNSVKVKSNESTAISYDGQILQSSTEYDWTLEVWDDTGKSISESFVFEIGLFENELVDASCISVEETVTMETNYTIDFDFIIETNNHGFCFVKVASESVKIRNYEDFIDI